MTSGICTRGGAWRDLLSKIKECYISIILFTYMDIDDFKGKQHLAHTVIPVAFWLYVIYNQEFSISNLQFIALSFGIILTIVQVVFRYIYQGRVNLGENTVSVETRKLGSGLLVFSGISFVYGFVSFICMLEYPKNIVIWTLISIYIILVGIIVLMVAYIAIKIP
jgi:hypothetical protein